MEWIRGTGCTGPTRAALAATVVAALATLAGLGSAAAHALPAPSPSAYVTNGTVYATASAGGYTYIGGTFTQVGPRVGHGMKLTATGDQYDPSFPDVAGGAVKAVASDGVGGWFIGGEFTSVQGQTRNRLAHILSDGSLDRTWNPDVNSTVRTIAVSEGNVFFGGGFTTVNGSTRNYIAAVCAINNCDGQGTPAGSATGWNPNANATVSAIAVSGTVVFFGGFFNQVNGSIPRNGIAAVCAINNCDGQETPAGRATGWDPDVGGDPNGNSVYAIAVAGGDVFFGGHFRRSCSSRG